MADRAWMTVHVQLTGGATAEMTNPAGRIMLVGPTHTFADLANSINAASAR